MTCDRPGCPECHPGPVEVDDRGFVHVAGTYAGRVQPSLIAGKRVWEAYDIHGMQQPRGGNLAHATYDLAAEALAKAVRHG